MQVWAEVLKRQSASQVMADQDHISQEFYQDHISKGQFQSKNRGNVNAYVMDTYDFHGLQFGWEPRGEALDISKLEQEHSGNLGMSEWSNLLSRP